MVNTLVLASFNNAASWLFGLIAVQYAPKCGHIIAVRRIMCSWLCTVCNMSVTLKKMRNKVHRLCDNVSDITDTVYVR